MIRRVVASTMVLAGVLLAGESVYAAPINAVDVPVHAKIGKAKGTVNLRVRNESKEPLVVKAGDTEMTLEPGKPVQLSMKVGETITVARGTQSYSEGMVLATINQEMKNSTITLH